MGDDVVLPAAPVADVRVKVSFKNNLLLTAMERAGIKTGTELARRAGLTQSRVSTLVCMRKPAKKDSQGWSDAALAVAAVLKCDPEDLFSWFQQYSRLEHNSYSLGAVSSEVASLAIQNGTEREENIEDLRRTLNVALATLKPYEERVLRLRFGLVPGEDTFTLREIGDEFGVSNTRIQQIEARALRKLKHPNRTKELKSFVGRTSDGVERLKLSNYICKSKKALKEHYHGADITEDKS